MKNVRLPVLGLVGILFFFCASMDVYAGSDIGIGVHYNVTSGDLDDTGFDSNYLSYVVSLRQRMTGNLSVEIALDYFPGRKEVEEAYRPFAALIWGDLINLGLGVTRTYVRRDVERSEWSDLSYQLQGGVRLPLWENTKLGLDALYFFQKFDEVRDIDGKNLTFAARLFFNF